MIRPRLSLRAYAAIAVVGLGIGFSGPYFPERFSDVRAFYCGGQAVLRHADPYREHPLLECERGVTAPALSRLRNDVAVPVPFPGYALALFALLSLLPFSVALAAWTIAACAALWGAIHATARVTRTPLAGVAIVIGFPALTVALPLGQITPFVLLAVAGAAVLLAAQRPRLAALAALGAMLDPHVGLAVVLGLAAGAARARTTLIAGLAGLAGLGTLISGPQHEREYVERVLPAHALANVPDSLQFSTTHFAYVAGVPAPLALTLGSIWYIAALAVGIVVALRLERRLGPASIVFIPPAFAVFGGTHTHLAQLALAVPAFLLIAANTAGRARAACVLITFVAALPWLQIAPFPLLFPGVAVLAPAFAQAMGIERLGLRLATATFGTLSAIFVTIVRSHTNPPLIDAHVSGNPLAQASWQIFVLARNSPPEFWYLFAKAPTVLAFFILFGVLVHAALGPRSIVPEC